MAAPGNKTVTCEKCFATIPPGATVCPECGAPLKNASVSDAEAAVYPDLARANLARMRGDYKAAEDQLLAVLKRYPNNPSANEMLGDLAMERDDASHAIQWYELALEILPDSASIARKVKDARAKLTSRDVQDTTSQLGLPDHSSRTPLIVAGVIVLLLLVAGGAYLIGSKGAPTAKGYQAPRSIINAPPENAQKPDGGASTATTPAAGTAAAGTDDAALTQGLQKLPEGAAILSAVEDPRAGTLTITFDLGERGDRAMAARIARDALLANSQFSIVTLRGLQKGKLAYIADVYRSKLEESLAPAWKQQHPEDPDAWISYVLANEWPAAAAPSPAAGTTTTGTEPPPGDTSATAGQPGSGAQTATGGGQ